MRKFPILILSVVFFVSITCFVQALPETVKIISYHGKVKILPTGKTDEISPELNMILKSGDMVTTGRGSYLGIAFDESELNIMHIGEKSHVVIILDGPDKIELIDGDVFTVLKGPKRGEGFRIKTPSAVCGARGTGWETVTDGKVTAIYVFDDKVFVQGVNADGSLMKKVFWIEKGFKREIGKLEEPGKMVKIPENKWSIIQEMIKFLEGQKGKSDKQQGRTGEMDRTLEKNSILDNERREGILDRKDKERLEKLREKDEKGRGTGGQLMG